MIIESSNCIPKNQGYADTADNEKGVGLGNGIYCTLGAFFNRY